MFNAQLIFFVVVVFVFAAALFCFMLKIRKVIRAKIQTTERNLRRRKEQREEKRDHLIKINITITKTKKTIIRIIMT